MVYEKEFAVIATPFGTWIIGHLMSPIEADIFHIDQPMEMRSIGVMTQPKIGPPQQAMGFAFTKLPFPRITIHNATIYRVFSCEEMEGTLIYTTYTKAKPEEIIGTKH